MLVCWYGLAMLVVPFYELFTEFLRQPVPVEEEQEHSLADEVEQFVNHMDPMQSLFGSSRFYQDVPKTPWALVVMARSEQGVPPEIIAKIVYPTLLGIGLVMTLFLGSHIQYMVRARTSLEHRIYVETLCKSLWQRRPLLGTSTNQEAEVQVTNPFDQGWRKNVKQMLGENLFVGLLPVHVEPPPPFFVSSKKQT